MKIDNNAQVQFKYTIKDIDGTILASSDDNEPATYIHGYSLILPKLEESLTGRSAGDTFDVTVSKDEGYGDRLDELVFEVDKAIFHAAEELQVGMEFQDEYSGNTVKIVELRGDKVLVDANHPYAGRDLVFSVTVDDVKPASDEDIKAIQKMIEEHSHDCSCGCHDGCGDECHCGDGCCE